MFLMAQLCIVVKKIKYVNLPCLFSVVHCSCLIPFCLYEKEPLQLCFIELRKKGSRISMPKLDHETFRDYFGGNLWRSDLFSDPVRVLSIGRNPIQVLLLRPDAVRVLSIRSDPIRSRFCKRPFLYLVIRKKGGYVCH